MMTPGDKQMVLVCSISYPVNSGVWLTLVPTRYNKALGRENLGVVPYLQKSWVIMILNKKREGENL